MTWNTLICRGKPSSGTRPRITLLETKGTYVKVDRQNSVNGKQGEPCNPGHIHLPAHGCLADLRQWYPETVLSMHYHQAPIESVGMVLIV